VSECLKNKKDLRILNLDNNYLGEKGAELLAVNLKGITGLTKLYLDSNQIGS
jgi:Leucine-rich repeat (LRR) protein